MDRVNGADWFDIGGGRRGFRGQNAALGIPGTEVTAAWLNAIQEEIAAVIERTGLVLDPSDSAQLYKALLAKTGAVDIPVMGRLASPPADPSEGDRYLVAPAPTGAWEDHPDTIATRAGGTWVFSSPMAGQQVQYWAGRQIVLRFDGIAWSEDLATTEAAGRVELATVEEAQEGTAMDLAVTPAGLAATARKRISAAVQLYVAKNGSDANDGLTPATAFATLQKAVDFARSIDTGGFSVTVNVANGTYTGAGAFMNAPLIGGGLLRFIGNPGSPSSVVIFNDLSSGPTSCFNATGGGQMSVDGFQLTSVNANGLYAQGPGSSISYRNMEFAFCALSHVHAFGGGQCVIGGGTYAIKNNASVHFGAEQGGTIYNNVSGQVISIGPSISIGTFARARNSGSMILYSLSFTGSLAAGQKYNISMNSTLDTGGAYPSFPGPTAGVFSTGGQVA